MMMKTRTASYLALFVALVFIYGCATSNVGKKDSPIGAWSYTVKNTPNGDVSGTMNIRQEGDGYTGNLSSNAGTIDLNDVVIEDNQLSSSFYFQGTPLQLKGTFSGDSFNGNVDAGGQSFPVEATRTSK